MKKVLILTTSTGQGHNKAANALVEVFSEHGYECVKADFLGNNGKILNRIIVKGYGLLASVFPSFYGWFYKFTDSKYTNKVLKLFFTLARKKLLKLINSTKPDIIIGTHPLTVNLISELKAKNLNIPFIIVVTDFKAHYTYISPLVDAYITGSEYTNKSLTSRGISRNNIFAYGIPISEGFYQKDSNIPYLRNDKYFNILLMSGSMGLDNISFVLDELIKNKHCLRVTAVCGNNKKLKESLSKKCEISYFKKKLHILGYSDDIASIMEYSDVIISKPGGLTVTESIIKHLPMIIPFTIPGQEQENLDFLISSGYSFKLNDLSDINPLIDSIIENPITLTEIESKLKIASSSYSPKKIVDVAETLLKKGALH